MNSRRFKSSISGPCQPSAGYRISRVQSAGRLRRAALEPDKLGEWRIWPTTAARQLLDQARNRSVWMTVYLAQVDLANPAAGRAHVVEPRTSGCDRRTHSRIEKQFAACVPNLDHLASAGRDAVVSGTRRLHGRPLGARHLFPFATAHAERHDRQSIQN